MSCCTPERQVLQPVGAVDKSLLEHVLRGNVLRMCRLVCKVALKVNLLLGDLMQQEKYLGNLLVRRQL